MTSKPFSQACENNQAPIYAHLQSFFSDRTNVLEVGSGTGQHAVYFGSRLKQLTWQCGDLLENHSGIQQWLNEANLSNVLPPLELDAEAERWNVGLFDAIFSANTLHIMSWQQVVNTFQHFADVLAPSGKLAIYGPFNYQGQFTSDSNAQFDQWLKQQVPHRGIRDFEKINQLASDIGLSLLFDHAMPANNRLLGWQRV